MTQDATLAHRRTGSGPLRTLLLHGFSDSAACWDPFIDRHRDLGGILAVDARGHGRSPLAASDRASRPLTMPPPCATWGSNGR